MPCVMLMGWREQDIRTVMGKNAIYWVYSVELCHMCAAGLFPAVNLIFKHLTQ